MLTDVELDFSAELAFFLPFPLSVHPSSILGLPVFISMAALPHLLPSGHLLRLPIHTLQEIVSYIYDPTPIVPFTPHATNPYPLPFSSTRQDLQAWSSTCRRTRDAALPLLSQFVKINGLSHLELLLRGENEERRSFLKSVPSSSSSSFHASIYSTSLS